MMKDTNPTTPKDIAEPVKPTMALATLVPVSLPNVSHNHSENTETKGSNAPKADRNADRKVIHGTMAIKVE